MKDMRKIADRSILNDDFEHIDRFLTKQEEREYHISPDLFVSCFEKTEKEIEEIKTRHTNVVNKYRKIAKERALEVLA